MDDRTCTTVSYSNLEMKDCMRARCARAEKLEKGAGWSLWIIVDLPKKSYCLLPMAIMAITAKDDGCAGG